MTYYGVCNCGQTVNGPQVEEDQCNLPCSGDSSEKCGGDNSFSIYTDPTFRPIDDTPDYAKLGCWTDDSSLGRALVFRQDQLDSATLTSTKCLDACHKGGFPFAGTQFGGECYCGVVIGNGTQAADGSECNMPCNGAGDEVCGGPRRLTLYVSKELESLKPCGTDPYTTTKETPKMTETTCQCPPQTSATKETQTTMKTPTATETPPGTESSSKAETPTTTEERPVCTETMVSPPECEYKCGKWCSKPLPDWHDRNTCKKAYSSCRAQVSSCFKQAGWPGSRGCKDFFRWCRDIKRHCYGPCRRKERADVCGKDEYLADHKPKGAQPPAVSTTVLPCTTQPPTQTMTPTPAPTQTGICKQPSNPSLGYGPGNPVGGVPLPVFTCKKAKKNTKVCDAPCKEQYNKCIKAYNEECKDRRCTNRLLARSGGGVLDSGADLYERTPGWSQNPWGGRILCQWQYWDCKQKNAHVKCRPTKSSNKSDSDDSDDDSSDDDSSDDD